MDNEFSELMPEELNVISAPYDNRNKEVAGQYQNEQIDSKQLKTSQKPVTTAVNDVIRLRLKQEAYRAKWKYKLRYKQDKWTHKDKVRSVKRNRKEKVATDRKARRAVRKANRKARWLALKAKFRRKK